MGRINPTNGITWYERLWQPDINFKIEEGKGMHTRGLEDVDLVCHTWAMGHAKEDEDGKGGQNDPSCSFAHYTFRHYELLFYTRGHP